jgi:hypothetical protein
MSYRMYRVFCATPGDPETGLEPERAVFHDVIGELNETEAMPLEILFVPVSVLPNLTSITVFQRAIDENIRDCTFFVQILQHTWGPPERSFEGPYRLAQECCADPQLPMKGVSVFFKAPGGREIEPAVAELKTDSFEFQTLDEFRTALRSQLSTWLRTVSQEAAVSGS